MADKRYRIRNNRLSAAYMEGISLLPDGALESYLYTKDSKPVHFHTAFLQPIDGSDLNSTWGRLSMKQIHEMDTAVVVYALAVNEKALSYYKGGPDITAILMDPKVSRERKLNLLLELGAKRQVNSGNMLLYDLEGRYLYLAIDVIGDGKAHISDILVHSEGDNFMQTFPEIYRGRGSFFHRWLSVFSSIYNDFQDEINDLPRLLDLDTCPGELLPIYASWLGIDLSGGFLPEEVCRALVKEGYELSKRKGTSYAISRIIEIVLGCEAEVLEHNKMRAYLQSDGAEIPQNLKDGGIYDVKILIHGQIPEVLRHQLMFLLNQFKPVRAKLHLIQLTNNAVTDGNTYLDMNAMIPGEQKIVLDEASSIGDVLTLE